MNEMLEYLLHEPIKKYGYEHVISVFEDKTYTYRYYVEKIKKFADIFCTNNIGSEPVIIMMDDSPLCIVCFLSLISIGAKPLIISPKTMSKVLKEIIRICKCRVLVTEKMLNEDMNDIKIHVLHCDEDGVTTQTALEPIEYKISGEVAYLALTSGSSGIPKIVMHSSREMYSAIKSYAISTLKITYNDVLFSIPKINFTYGLANSLFFSFATGAKSIIYKKSISPCEIGKIIEKYEVTYFFAVPTVYERMIHNVNSNELRTIDYFISAGEYLPQMLNNNWYKIAGKYIFDSVGCSETGSAYLFNDNPEYKNGSAGKPVKGYELKLIDGDGRKGQLIVYGPSNAIGYLNNSDLSKDKFIDSAIYTGDWFEIDEDGYYWFLGRNDDMIKKNGRWVSLNEITNGVKQISNVRNAVTFLLNNKIVLLVEVAKDCMVDDIKKILSNQLEHYKLPNVIKFGIIPLNLNGKVDLRRVKEEYEE